ncbi:MAG: hypothetical protein ACFFCM_03200 [Promethearchaeota archaeon]
MIIEFIIISLISIVPLFVPCILFFYQFIKRRERYVLLVTLAWFFWALFIIISFLSFLYASIPLLELAGVLMVPVAFSFFLFIDSISRESADPKKLVIITAASLAYFIIHLTPGSIILFRFPNGYLYFNVSTADFLSYSFLILLIEGNSIFFLAKIYRNAPNNLKYYTAIGFYSQLIGGSIYVIGGAVNLESLVSGISFLIIGFSTLPLSIVFLKKPQIAFILPFKALRLMVIDTNIGLPLFTHIWNVKEDTVSEGLFSGMIQGVSLILNESVKKGNVREIHLEQAILIIRRSEKFTVACVLVTTKTSRSLRQALDAFADKFFRKFSPYFSDPSNLDNFKAASDLIKDHFSFIPKYD